MEELIQVGTITSPHGVRGEVKVYPATDDLSRFKKLKQVILDLGKEQITLQIIQVKFIKNLAILKFKDYDNINDVEAWRSRPLYIDKKDAVKCEKDEYFISDLIGLSVETEAGEALGELTDVLKTGANDVYAITDTNGKELLLPAIHECIRAVDLEKRTMIIHLMAGLRD